MIEAFNYVNNLNNSNTNGLIFSLLDHLLLIIYYTPVLSANSLIH